MPLLRGELVHSGRGDAYREVPLKAVARQVLGEWLAERQRLAVDGEQALFLGRGGRRFAKRSVGDVVRGVGLDAGMHLSAHVLRDTFLTALVRRVRIWCSSLTSPGIGEWRPPAVTASRPTPTQLRGVRRAAV